MTAKASEANSVAAIASAFYRGVVETYCKGQHLDSDIPCGGRAILRKFSQGKMNGKTYFIGCSNWAHGDSAQMSKIHRFVPIPSAVWESILLKLFKGEPIDDEDNDTEVLAGSCMQIIHPSHLPKNSVCPRNHYHDGVHVVAKLKKHECRAQLSILVPINDKDLRAVIIPAAGVPHNHPSFTRTKIPAEVKMKYQQCIDAAGPVGMTTLRIDKSSSTHSILAGRLPQELHPGMINSRKRRDMVKDTRETMYPDGTGLPAIYFEFDKDRSHDIQDRYIHAVMTRPDGTHVIITINPELAFLTLDAIWIMVDTTFGVVHGETNEWKLVIWLNSIDKRTVIGRVWSNRASREAFVLVWNGIFDAIETITGKKLNFKLFSPKSKLLGVTKPRERLRDGDYRHHHWGECRQGKTRTLWRSLQEQNIQWSQKYLRRYCRPSVIGELLCCLPALSVSLGDRKSDCRGPNETPDSKNQAPTRRLELSTCSMMGEIDEHGSVLVLCTYKINGSKILTLSGIMDKMIPYNPGNIHSLKEDSDTDSDAEEEEEEEEEDDEDEDEETVTVGKKRKWGPGRKQANDSLVTFKLVAIHFFRYSSYAKPPLLTQSQIEAACRI
ncbi:hypothetical protein B0H10DRAFT_1954356 [Mycena sp. CBHHK59/15]|nr:hypothetical protein B0H10DRAFT_1954356 [Mycena sp. CBHHK59/15]